MIDNEHLKRARDERGVVFRSLENTDTFARTAWERERHLHGNPGLIEAEVIDRYKTIIRKCENNIKNWMAWSKWRAEHEEEKPQSL